MDSNIPNYFKHLRKIWEHLKTSFVQISTYWIPCVATTGQLTPTHDAYEFNEFSKILGMRSISPENMTLEVGSITGNIGNIVMLKVILDI